MWSHPRGKTQLLIVSSDDCVSVQKTSLVPAHKVFHFISTTKKKTSTLKDNSGISESYSLMFLGVTVWYKYISIFPVIKSGGEIVLMKILRHIFRLREEQVEETWGEMKISQDSKWQHWKWSQSYCNYSKVKTVFGLCLRSCNLFFCKNLEKRGVTLTSVCPWARHSLFVRHIQNCINQRYHWRQWDASTQSEFTHHRHMLWLNERSVLCWCFSQSIISSYHCLFGVPPLIKKQNVWASSDLWANTYSECPVQYLRSSLIWKRIMSPVEITALIMLLQTSVTQLLTTRNNLITQRHRWTFRSSFRLRWVPVPLTVKNEGERVL